MLDRRAHAFRRTALGDDELAVETERQASSSVANVELAPGHARADVQSDLAEDDHRSSGHVLAAVVAGTLDDGRCTGVANGEALAGASGRGQLAAGGAVEH